MNEVWMRLAESVPVAVVLLAMFVAMLRFMAKQSREVVEVLKQSGEIIKENTIVQGRVLELLRSIQDEREQKNV